MKTFQLFLTHTYLTSAGWFGVYDLLDQRGFCHGNKIITAESRDELLQKYGQQCEC